MSRRGMECKSEELYKGGVRGPQPRSYRRGQGEGHEEAIVRYLAVQLRGLRLVWGPRRASSKTLPQAHPA